MLFISFILTGCSGKDKEPDLPDHSGFVNDYTGKIGSEWLGKTENLVKTIEQETSCEIGVAIIESLEGAAIEEYSVKLYEQELPADLHTVGLWHLNETSAGLVQLSMMLLEATTIVLELELLLLRGKLVLRDILMGRVTI